MSINIKDDCKVPFFLAGGNPEWKPKSESHLELVPPLKAKLPESYRAPRGPRKSQSPAKLIEDDLYDDE